MERCKLIVDIPSELDQVLKNKADQMMVTRSAIVRLAVKEYCSEAEANV